MINVLIMCLTQVNSENDLQPLCHAWVSSNKTEWHTILWTHLNKSSVTLALLTPMAIVDVTMTLVSLMFSLPLQKIVLEQQPIKARLQSSAVTYHSQKTVLEQQNINTIFNLMQLFAGVPLIKDMFFLKEAIRIVMPTTK
jgi:hypothetical protein